MTRLLAFAVAAALSVAGVTGLSPTLASTSVDARIDDLGWQVPGTIFHYQATVPGTTAVGTFDVLVHEVVGNVVRVDVVILDAGETYALQGSYDRLTREDVAAPGVHVPLWIRQADVDRGVARLGSRDLAYDAAGSALHHVFADSESRYAFHKSAGYLVSVENVRGGRVLLVGAGVGAPLPVDPQTARSEPIAVEGQETLGAGTLEEGEYRLPIRTIDLLCGMDEAMGDESGPRHSLDGFLGAPCETRFEMETTNGFSYGRFHLEFPRFTIGDVRVLYRDTDTAWGGGIVRNHTCAPIAVISTANGTVACSIRYPREFIDAHVAGDNWIETQGTWKFCLDPTTQWSCNYTWTTPATGRIACPQESDACRTRPSSPG